MASLAHSERVESAESAESGVLSQLSQLSQNLPLVLSMRLLLPLQLKQQLKMLKLLSKEPLKLLQSNRHPQHLQP